MKYTFREYINEKWLGIPSWLIPVLAGVIFKLALGYYIKDQVNLEDRLYREIVASILNFYFIYLIYFLVKRWQKGRKK